MVLVESTADILQLSQTRNGLLSSPLVLCCVLESVERIGGDLLPLIITQRNDSWFNLVIITGLRRFSLASHAVDKDKVMALGVSVDLHPFAAEMTLHPEGPDLGAKVASCLFLLGVVADALSDV